MPVSSSTEHWIKPDALTINLNHFGDPDYLQVSVLAGAVVMAFKQDVIGYNAAHNYRTWPLDAANTYLETTSAYNVYARLTRSEVNARALIVYDTVLRDIEGREITYAEDGSEVLGDANPDYFFVFLGQISASVNSNGESVQREWVIDFRAGVLDTTEQNNYSGFLLEKMFKPHFEDKSDPNKLTSIQALAGLWTDSFLSAKGNNPGSGSSSEGGATTLGGLRNVTDDADSTYDVAKMLVLEADSNLWTLKNLSELVGGLDEAELEEYLTNNEYAKKSDIPSLSGYATEQWVLGKGYLTEHQDLSAYAKKTDIPTKVSAFDNDANYATTSDLDARIDALVNGAPQAYDTLKEIADVLAGNVDSIDDILTALGTKVNQTDFDAIVANLQGGIDGLWARNSYDELYVGHLMADTLSAETLLGNLAWEYVTGKPTTLDGYGITDAYTKSIVDSKLSLKLDAVTFNELFEKVQLEDGTWAIKAKLGLFSDGFISAKGSNVGGTSSEGGAAALYQLNDVAADGTQVSGAQDGAVFVYDGKQGKWKGIAQSEIVPNLTGYATESWVLQQGFLTQHQDLSAYAKLTDIPTTDINKGVTAYGWGDHSKVGYLTGITSALVTRALGYTPYDSANFTKAKIKSTLGISDWALASSKPSYTTKEVAEDTNLYFTNARAVAALKSITDGLSGNISTLQGYFTDGVANSAAKLTTARTIWGQSFDGTGNVSGNLKLGANAITGDDNRFIIDSQSSALHIGYGYRELPVTYWGGSYAFNGGNVLIGTTTDSGYKLHVNGTLNATTLYQNGIAMDSIIDGFVAALQGGIDALWARNSYDELFVGHLSADSIGAESITGDNVVATKIQIGNGTIEWDEANKGFKVTGGLYTESYLSAKGANSSGGSSSGGGLITSLYRYADLGKTFADTSNDTFNAYTINKINTDLGSRISVLEGKATNVTYTANQTSGTLLGTLTIDGASKSIYAPTIPTSLKNPYALTINNSGGTAQVSYDGSAAKLLTLTKAMVGLGSVENTALSTWTGTNKITTLGTITTGVWNGTKIANGYLANSAITIAGTSVSLGGSITAATLQSNLGLGSFAYISSLAFSSLTNKPTTISGYGITDAYTASTIDSKLSGYLPLSGGTITSATLGALEIKRNSASGHSGIKFLNNTEVLGILGVGGAANSTYAYQPMFQDKDAKSYILIHSGNIGSQSVASAAKLTTARTIWGQSFDGTGNVSGNLKLGANAITGDDNRFIIDSQSSALHIGYGYRELPVTYWGGSYAFNGGNVLIGTTTDSGYKLHVNGTLNATTLYQNGIAMDSIIDGYVTALQGGIDALWARNEYDELHVGHLMSDTIAANAIYADRLSEIYFNGTNVGVGTSSATYKLQVSGTMCASGAVTLLSTLSVSNTIYSGTGIYTDGYVSAKGQNTSSDMRLKNVLGDVVLGVGDIANAPSVRFAWKNGGGIDVGSSAQYWQKLLPDAIKERDGHLEMQYANIALLSAIAIAKRMETHEERIARLEKENSELRLKIERLQINN